MCFATTVILCPFLARRSAVVRPETPALGRCVSRMIRFEGNQREIAFSFGVTVPYYDDVRHIRLTEIGDLMVPGIVDNLSSMQSE